MVKSNTTTQDKEKGKMKKTYSQKYIKTKNQTLV